MAEFCNEETCLRGNFAQCHKNHEVIKREGKTTPVVANDFDVKHNEITDEESESEVNIFEYDKNSIDDDHVQFIDAQANPSVLDSLFGDRIHMKRNHNQR